MITHLNTHTQYPVTFPPINRKNNTTQHRVYTAAACLALLVCLSLLCLALSACLMLALLFYYIPAACYYCLLRLLPFRPSFVRAEPRWLLSGKQNKT